MRIPRGIYLALYPFLAVLYWRGFRRKYRTLRELLGSPWEVICFFPTYQMGGAEKVHAGILKALEGHRVLTIITHKSKNTAFKAAMEGASTALVDLGKYGDNTVYARLFRKMIAQEINRPVTLFGCNTMLFYGVAGAIRSPLVKKVDLLHAFSPYGNGIEDKTLPFVDALDNRVIINHRTLEDFREQYRRHGVSESMLDRITLIENAVPAEIPVRIRTKATRCLFAARGSAEKRPWIYGRIATRAAERKLPLQFSSIGDNQALVGEADRPQVHFYGLISDENEIYRLYGEHDVLITCSEYEGFPMTIMEGMAGGIVNLSVSVGGIPEHLSDGQNGLLIAPEGKTEAQLTDAFCAALDNLSNHPERLRSMSEEAARYAAEHFSFRVFREKYIRLLVGGKS